MILFERLEKSIHKNTASVAIKSTEPLKIGFLTTLGVNVGDDFIRHGIRHCFDRLAVPWIPFFVNKHDSQSLYETRDGEVDRLDNKIFEADIFVQSGSPVYWHHGEHGHRSTMAEWHEWAWEKGLLASTEAPVLLNLGAGSCQPWGDAGDSFVRDPECASFAQRVGARSRLTTVRDSVASSMLTQLKVPHSCLPCPAFVAGASFSTQSAAGTLIGINVMPKGGHFEFQENRGALNWARRLHDMLRTLRREGHLLFICHSIDEKHFAEMFAVGNERIFYSPNFRDYFDVFRMLSCTFSNRVHAAVTAAGFGVPGLIAGTDTRVQIGQWLGLEVVHSPELVPDEAAGMIVDLLKDRRKHRERLLCLRDEVEARYLNLLAPIVESTYSRTISSTAMVAVHPVLKWAESFTDLHPWTARLGIEPHWPIEEVGFHAPEMCEGEQLRWTNGQAMLQIPDELTIICTGIEIVFWNLHPPAFCFHVLINGCYAVDEAKDGSCPWTGRAAFQPQALRTIEIVSDVLTPEGETRTLGMALRRIRLLGMINSGDQSDPC